MKYRPEMTQELLKQFVHYCPESGVLRRTHVLNRAHTRIEKESIPTSVTAQGYFQLNMFKTPYLVHRLAFLYMTGRMPDMVDHINGDRLNNKWGNLREVDPATNSKNLGVSVNNKSGVPGVYFYPRYNKWEVTIWAGGEHYYLGRFVDFDEAVAVRRNAEKLLGYHENHGRRESW